MSQNNKVENDTLKVYLEATSMAKLKKAIAVEDKTLIDLGIKGIEKKRSIDFTVEYERIKGKKEKHIGSGETLEDAVEEVKSKFTKIPKSVRRTYKANIRYTLKKEEIEEYKKKKKPSAAAPLLTDYLTNEDMIL